MVKRSGVPNYVGCKVPLPSPINITYLEQKLAGYHDDRIIKFLKYGFPINHNGVTGSRALPRNHAGARDYAHELKQQLDNECRLHACVGPFVAPPISDLFYSPLNSVLKRESNRRRLVLDLSFPPGNAINDGIDKDWYQGVEEKLQLPSIDSLVEKIIKLGPGCKVFKVDLERCYKQFFICPGDINLVAFHLDELIYIDCTLSMGSRSSARCCQYVTSAIVFIFVGEGYFAINYLDDLGGADSADKAELAFNTLRSILSKAGLKEASEKACPPCTNMTFLGIEVCTVTLTLTIPQVKLMEIKTVINEWSLKSRATLKQVQQLAGLLNFACRCVKPGRIYLSRVLNFLRAIPQSGAVTIPSQVQLDLDWWRQFLEQYNGISFMPDNGWSAPDMIISSDSCLTGGGALTNSQFFHIQFSHNVKNKCSHINQLECMVLVSAVALWAPNLIRKKLIMLCDNMNTVLAVNSGCSRDPILQAALRKLHQVTALFSCEVRAKFLAGESNRAADYLSRWHLNKSYEKKFYQLEGCLNLQQVSVNNDMFEFIFD